MINAKIDDSCEMFFDIHSQPLLTTLLRFSFWRGNGLDDTEYAFNVGTINLSHFSIMN